MNCPRCAEPLVQETREGEELEVCRSCGGMWLHRHQLNRLLKEAHGDVEFCSYDEVAHGDTYRPIPCRQCADTMMKKINFLEYSNIVMDYCPVCGSFWLDRDELAQMHQYIQKVEEGSHEVKDRSAYAILTTLSRFVYAIFH